MSDPIEPNVIDFVTLSDMKTWIESLPSGTTPDDKVLSEIITAASQNILNMMGKTSILNANYKEWYDGTGNATLFLDENPIIAINSLKIYGVDVSSSADRLTSGYAIDRDRKCIQLVGGGSAQPVLQNSVTSWRGNSCGGNVFPRGTQNVYVDYNAGYQFNVPYDLSECCKRIIDQTYRRRGWVDKKQIALPQGGGTTTYRDWDITPYDAKIINNYTRSYR